ncbi:MAG: response regulator [Planctomycetota bacterium]|nr:response regulator [Planctomycetota bacterium]
MAEQKVFVVDDEVKVLEAVGETLGNLGVEVTCFVHPVQCLERLRSQKCDLLIADLRMAEMDGIELLEHVQRHAPWVPVMVMTGYGDVPTAVRAIKAGAIDLIEKPLDKSELISRVKAILRENVFTDTCVGKPLTAIQTKVLKLVIDGKSNKEIAGLLDRSVRTIEVHRAHMMEKLGVNNLLDLVKRAVSLGLIDLTTQQEPEPD